jgi:hypothetical protein
MWGRRKCEKFEREMSHAEDAEDAGIFHTEDAEAQRFFIQRSLQKSHSDGDAEIFHTENTEYTEVVKIYLNVPDGTK